MTFPLFKQCKCFCFYQAHHFLTSVKSNNLFFNFGARTLGNCGIKSNFLCVTIMAGKKCSGPQWRLTDFPCIFIVKGMNAQLNISIKHYNAINITILIFSPNNPNEVLTGKFSVFVTVIVTVGGCFIFYCPTSLLPPKASLIRFVAFNSRPCN